MSQLGQSQTFGELVHPRKRTSESHTALSASGQYRKSRSLERQQGFSGRPEGHRDFP